MYYGQNPARTISAGTPGAEGGTVGLGLAVSLFVLHIDARCGALAVKSVILAVCYIAAHAADDFGMLFVVHF